MAQIIVRWNSHLLCSCSYLNQCTSTGLTSAPNRRNALVLADPWLTVWLPGSMIERPSATVRRMWRPHSGHCHSAPSSSWTISSSLWVISPPYVSPNATKQKNLSHSASIPNHRTTTCVDISGASYARSRTIQTCLAVPFYALLSAFLRASIIGPISCMTSLYSALSPLALSRTSLRTA